MSDDLVDLLRDPDTLLALTVEDLAVIADRLESLQALHRTDTELRRATQEANNRLAARNRRLVQALREAGVSHYVDCPALTEGDDCTCDEWEAE